MAIQLRNYRERDLELIVVLLNAAEAVDRAETGTSVVELREELTLPGLRPEENVFVAEDEEGRLVAYARLMLKDEAEESGFRTWLNVHPMFRGRGLEDRLLARLEARARERMTGLGAEKVYFSCGVHTAYPERLRAIERAGMREVRRFWIMVRPNLKNLSEPRFPDGLTLRSYRMGEDDAQAREAVNDAFREHFGYADESLADWQHFVHSVNYRPELTVLAIDPRVDRIAGFCHITVNEGECQRIDRRRGWIDTLGVRREYRRQGLGEALILQGMRNLANAGVQEAALGCDSENTTGATRLYFRVGYQVFRTWIAFDKYLREPSARVERDRAPAVA